MRETSSAPSISGLPASRLLPELFGPIIIAGTPLSFWAGLKGQNPFRYSGGTVVRS